MADWMSHPWLAFDTETTGVDVETDKIVSVAVVEVEAGRVPAVGYRLLNWNIDIPEGAYNVHKLSREKLAREGRNPADVLTGVCKAIASGWARGCVLVGMNVVFDLTMLDRNCRELGIIPLSDRVAISPVADAMVLDKYVDPFRKGTRRLTALAEHYQVPAEDAHNAAADAIMAARVLWRIGRAFPTVGGMTATALHSLQIEAKAKQDAGMARYRKGKNESVTGLDGVWPIRPYRAAVPAPADGLEDVPLW